MATNADAKTQEPVCPACGGRLRVFVRLKAGQAPTPLAYFKCERCAHIVIAEE